jgi:hypothetical protein
MKNNMVLSALLSLAVLFTTSCGTETNPALQSGNQAEIEEVRNSNPEAVTGMFDGILGTEADFERLENSIRAYEEAAPLLQEVVEEVVREQVLSKEEKQDNQRQAIQDGSCSWWGEWARRQPEDWAVIPEPAQTMVELNWAIHELARNACVEYHMRR